jgi:hypothetical protein
MRRKGPGVRRSGAKRRCRWRPDRKPKEPSAGSTQTLLRYHCNSCGALNALTKTPIARLREMERWLDTVNAMIEGLSLPKAPRRDGIRAATAFRSRPRSQPSLGKLGAPAVAPAAGTSGPNAPDIHSNNLNAYQGRLGQWTRHGAGAENPINYPGFGRALEACGDQARPCWILAALHKFRFIPAILLTLNSSLALAVAPGHAPPGHTTTPSPSPSY